MFLFSVYFPSSFFGSQIYYSLDFPPSFMRELLGWCYFFSSVKCTHEISLVEWLFFFPNRKSSKRMYYNIKPPCNKQWSWANSSKTSEQSLYIAHSSFSCINFTVRRLTVFVMSIP